MSNYNCMGTTIVKLNHRKEGAGQKVIFGPVPCDIYPAPWVIGVNLEQRKGKGDQMIKKTKKRMKARKKKRKRNRKSMRRSNRKNMRRGIEYPKKRRGTSKSKKRRKG